MRRGEIWRASLPDPVESGPDYRRPVLVVQSKPFNDSHIATVIVAVITIDLALTRLPEICG
jgi:mRNA interferase MazF